jgi:hypothetical protein
VSGQTFLKEMGMPLVLAPLLVGTLVCYNVGPETSEIYFLKFYTLHDNDQLNLDICI